MPALDHACHEDAEDLRVLREALGPARSAPLHAEEMRGALARTRSRRFSVETVRRRIAAVRATPRAGVFAPGA